MSGRMLRAGVLAAALAAWAGVATAQVRNWPEESAPKPLAARPLTFPAHELRTLPNGLRVVAVELHEQPVVSLRLLVGAGAAQDVAPRLGVATMVASLLDQGTATRSAQQIADTVEAIGGDIAVGAGTDATFARVTVLSDSVAPGLDLLADMVRAPAFRPEDLERQRARVRSALRVSYQDPEYVASAVLKRLVYGFHPYAFPAAGTPASVERITRADLVEFHERHFVPGNCILAVVGDIGTAEAFAAAARAFGGWAARDVSRVLMLGPPAPARRVVVVDMPAAMQTEIRVGQLGTTRTAEDFTATDLAVRILGGGGANRLRQSLVTKRGFAYAASAALNAYRYAGDITAESGTRPEAGGEALRVMVDEFFRLQRERVDSRELDAAKAHLAGGYPLTIETPDEIATRIVTAIFYGLPLAELDTSRERVAAVSIDDLEKAARAHLRPDRLSIVLVGFAPYLASELQRLGFRFPEVIPLENLDLTAADLRRAGGPGRATAPPLTTVQGVSRESWDEVRAIIDAATAAAGGLDALRGVRTFRATAKTLVQTPAGPMRATTRTSVEYHDWLDPAPAPDAPCRRQAAARFLRSSVQRKPAAQGDRRVLQQRREGTH